MKRIDISISAKVYLPEGIDAADYMRAVANHLADTLPAQQPHNVKAWRAGREVAISVESAIVDVILPPVPSPATPAEPVAFENARFGDLPTQAELL